MRAAEALVRQHICADAAHIYAVSKTIARTGSI